jgi:Zn finger protein HypA/HybF involved in hydrogenase expression
MTKSRRKRSIIWKDTREKFQSVCNDCESYADILRYYKLHVGAGNYRTLKRRISEDSIDVEHIAPNGNAVKTNSIHRRNGDYHFSFDETFCKNSRNKTSNQNRIRRLLAEKVWAEYECSECGIGNLWNGKLIVLQLDHINGITTDNRVENLRLLCPNCHSQTKNWGAKNIKSPSSKG